MADGYQFKKQQQYAVLQFYNFYK